MLLLSQATTQAAERDTGEWPEQYRNSETGKVYRPHHEDERRAVFSFGPERYVLIKGGEGGGKSVAGIIKGLERVRYGMSGMMVSPDMPHFRRSLWPEFRRWCPWERVVPGHQRRRSPEWEPSGPFKLVFKNGAVIYCGGMYGSKGEPKNFLQ